MNKEDYVSLEVAKLLKQKGYNERCEQRFVEKIDGTEREEWDDDLCAVCTVSDAICYPKPTLYEATKWLRERHIYVASVPSYNFWLIEKKFTFLIDKLDNNGEWDCGWEQQDDDFYKTYEEALNAGILEALKLI